MLDLNVEITHTTYSKMVENTTVKVVEEKP